MAILTQKTWGKTLRCFIAITFFNLDFIAKVANLSLEHDKNNTSADIKNKVFLKAGFCLSPRVQPWCSFGPLNASHVCVSAIHLCALMQNHKTLQCICQWLYISNQRWSHHITFTYKSCFIWLLNSHATHLKKKRRQRVGLADYLKNSMISLIVIWYTFSNKRM